MISLENHPFLPKWSSSKLTFAGEISTIPQKPDTQEHKCLRHPPVSFFSRSRETCHRAETCLRDGARARAWEISQEALQKLLRRRSRGVWGGVGMAGHVRAPLLQFSLSLWISKSWSVFGIKIRPMRALGQEIRMWLLVVSRLANCYSIVWALLTSKLYLPWMPSALPLSSYISSVWLWITKNGPLIR